VWRGDIIAGGFETVTITLSAAVDANLWVSDFTGLGAFDTSVGQWVTAVGTAATPTLVTHGDDELVYALVGVNTGNVTGTVAAPFTQLSPVGGDDSAYTVASAPGSFSASWPMSGSGSACAIAAAVKPKP
jgi:hypothetical protein